jgi:hypothetical protein
MPWGKLKSKPAGALKSALARATPACTGDLTQKTRARLLALKMNDSFRK